MCCHAARALTCIHEYPFSRAALMRLFLDARDCCILARRQYPGLTLPASLADGGAGCQVRVAEEAHMYACPGHDPSLERVPSCMLPRLSK